MIFVAAHAVNIMVVDHANQGFSATYERINHAQIGHFVDVHGIGPEFLHRGPRNDGIPAIRDRKSFGKNLPPEFLTLPGCRPMENSHDMPALFQFRSGDVGVDLGPCHRTETFMNKKQSHCKVVEYSTKLFPGLKQCRYFSM